MSDPQEIAAQTSALTNLITALGGPAVVGGLLMTLLRRSMNKMDSAQSTKFESMSGRFDVVASEMKTVSESNKSQELALADIKTRLAIYEVQSTQMSRALEEFRSMDKALTIMQSRVDASFRIIDDLKNRVDRLDGRIDRVDAEQSGIREALRAPRAS